MNGVNKVILIGNLGKDPEVRYLEGGIAVAKFPLATSESFNDRATGERKSQTEWHNIVMWRGNAETAEKFLKKGDRLYVEGKLRNRSWNDQNGIKKYITEIVCDNFTMLGSASKAGEHAPGSQPLEQSNPAADPVLPSSGPADDLPF